MDWLKQIKAFLNTIKQDRATLASMREDINTNLSDISKLLYRLEEAEYQIKTHTSLLVDLEAHKQDKFDRS